jgi:hypothetical protein
MPVIIVTTPFKKVSSTDILRAESRDMTKMSIRLGLRILNAIVA